MKKSWIAVLLCALLLCSAPVTAFAAAAGYSPPAANNTRVNPLELAQLHVMVAVANLSIDLLVAWAQFTPYNDVPWLLAQERMIVNEVMEYANRIGATVVCEYKEYTIDGQKVLIDPLRVVN